MKVESFTYHPDRGWSIQSFPNLDSPQTLIIIFGASEYRKESDPIKELMLAYPYSHIVGCSSSGEIFGVEVHDHSLSIGIIKFDKATIATASEELKRHGDSFSVGKALAEQLCTDTMKSILVLSDGLHINGSELVNGLNSLLPKSAILTGGFAGDGDKFEKTWVLNNNQPKSGIVTAVALYGNSLQIGHYLVNGTSNARLQTIQKANHNGSNILTIAISCIGRRLVLGERIAEEIEATMEHLPNKAKQIGFYSYGEISPSGVGSCEVDNQTMTLTTISEH